jgi:type VI secretion system protein ImpH
MATYGWGTVHPVKDWLFEEGYRFDFYQAVRLLEMIYPEKLSVGESSEPDFEVVRFRSRVSLTFPSGQISAIKAPLNGEPAEMTVDFMGLAGVHGPLPLPYTELLLERIRAKDTAMRDFFDMFNHRLVSLMYRVRKLHRVGLHTGSPDRSPMARYLFAVMGMGTKGLQGRTEVEDRSLLFYAGILSQHPRSMAGLEAILRDYFDAPVSGIQLTGAWLDLDADQSTVIGETGRNQILGESAVLGTRVWDQRRKFDLHLGPLPFDRFVDFLPDGPAYAPLCSLVRLYASDEYEFDLHLSVKPETIPGITLSGEGGARLGWTSWFAPSAAELQAAARSGPDATAKKCEIRLTPSKQPTTSTKTSHRDGVRA